MQGPDAIELLEGDHRQILAQFADYAALVGRGAPAAERQQLAERICTELAIHTRLEDEIFYPAVRGALREDDAVDASEQQHESIRDFIAQILALRAHEKLYDARMAVLRDHVERHVRLEREALFARLAGARTDLRELGARLAARRAELAAVAEALREEALASALS